MHLEFIAFLAGLISATAAIPQIWTLIRTRDTNGISGFMFGMKNVSCSLWVVFGIISSTYSIVFWNAISLSLCLTVVVMKHIIQRQNAMIEQPVENNNIIALPKLAIDNTIMEALMQAAPKRPALRLVYTRPRETQQILPLGLESIESASSPTPQA